MRPGSNRPPVQEPFSTSTRPLPMSPMANPVRNALAGQGYPQSHVAPGPAYAPSYDASHAQPIVAQQQQQVSHHPGPYPPQQAQHAQQQQPFTSQHPGQHSPFPPSQHQQQPPHASQHPNHAPAYARQGQQGQSQAPNQGAHPQSMMPPPQHFAQPQPPPQHFAQPSFPPHFAPPTRGLPSTAAPAQNPSMPRSSVIPAAARSSRASAFPPADDMFAPDATMPPPNLVAACVFLGGPLFLATMVVAVLALR